MWVLIIWLYSSVNVLMQMSFKWYKGFCLCLLPYLHSAACYKSILHTWHQSLSPYKSSVCVYAGLVEIEEGEMTAQQLNLQSEAVARISFAREPHVQQVIVLSLWKNNYLYMRFKYSPHTRRRRCPLSHPLDLSGVSAATRRPAWADRFHGDWRPGTDAAFARHLPTSILTQPAPWQLSCDACKNTSASDVRVKSEKCL